MITNAFGPRTGYRDVTEADGDRSDAEASSTDPGSGAIGRRKLLRTGVNLGASAALVFGLGANYVSSEDLGRITYAMARPDPGADAFEPRTKEVPVEWHESLQLAFEAQERIRAAGISALAGSFVVPGSYDDPEALLSVDATDEGVRERLDGLIEGVGIELDVVEEIPPRPEEDLSPSEAYQISGLDSGPVPGGVVCGSDDQYGTLAPALFDAESGSRFFATSNHVYGAAGTRETEHRGAPLALLHDDERHRIGTVERGYPTADLVTIAPDPEYRPAPAIERASPARVSGQYTKEGLADLMARDEPLTKLGAFSDHSTGPINGIDGVTCYAGQVCKQGQLKWGDEDGLVDGDSGSVNFHEDPENPEEAVLVGGINNARTWWPGDDFVWGTAGYHLLEEYGFHF